MAHHHKITTIQVDAEVMAEEDSMAELALVPVQLTETTTKQKPTKTRFINAPAEKLANLDISIHATEKRIKRDKETLSSYKRRRKELVKLLDRINNL